MASGRLQRRPLLWILLLFAALHAGLLLYDLSHPEARLMGDRSKGRLAAIVELHQRVAAGEGFGAVLSELGHPGDFMFHYPAYVLAGEVGILLLQILLQLLTVVLLYRLAVDLFGAPRLAAVAAATYMILPGTLLHTHTITSEAVFNPLVLLVVLLLVRSLRSGGWAALAGAGVLSGLASLIRPLNLLFPGLLGALLLLARGRRGLVPAAWLVVIATAIPLGWLSYAQTQTGAFSMGMGKHSLSHNLYVRAERMARIGDLELAPAAIDSERLGPAAFLGQVVRHPIAYLQTFVSDAGNAVLNSGINTFAGRYLKLYELPGDTAFSMRARDEVGWLGLIRIVLGTSPVMALVNIVAGLAWLAFLAGAAVGAWLLVRSVSVTREMKLLLLLVPVYYIAAGQAGYVLRWGYRTPGEFVLALLFALALAWLAGWCDARTRFVPSGAPDGEPRTA